MAGTNRDHTTDAEERQLRNMLAKMTPEQRRRYVANVQRSAEDPRAGHLSWRDGDVEIRPPHSEADQ